PNPRKHGEDEMPFNPIISLLNVNLDKHSDMMRYASPFHAFPNCDDVIQDETPL
ncbi:hypothetical protein KI387_018833, partial [Taxus chinensis]